MEAFETKAMPGQIKIDEAEGIVECFVAGVGNKDSVGDIVLPGAFTASLKRRKPRVVWGHDWNQPIGKVLDIYEVPPTDRRLPDKMRAAGIGGLFAKVQFNLKAERGREAFANVAFFGTEQEWSIGYKTLDAIYDNARQANLLKEVELYEVSPVLHGANQLTATISIKSDDPNSDDRISSFKKSDWPMFDRTFAEMIKKEHPEIWDAGGNIKGDDQYTILTRIAERRGKNSVPDRRSRTKGGLGGSPRGRLPSSRGNRSDQVAGDWQPRRGPHEESGSRGDQASEREDVEQSRSRMPSSDTERAGKPVESSKGD